MNVIDGKQIASEIFSQLRELPNPGKKLAIISVGEDGAAQSFIRAKEKAGTELGIEVKIFHEVPDSTALIARIHELSRDVGCGGIVVQLPLPPSINRDVVLSEIANEKDVDSVSFASREMGAIFSPAVLVVQRVLAKFSGLSGPDLDAWMRERVIAVVGSSGFLIGAPISTWASHSFNYVNKIEIGDEVSLVSSADVVVLGSGSPGIVNEEMLKDGALVIDFGYGMKNGKSCGDFIVKKSKPNGGDEKTFSYTPTPGGTGPILVASLFENFFKLNA